MLDRTLRATFWLAVTCLVGTTIIGAGALVGYASAGPITSFVNLFPQAAQLSLSYAINPVTAGLTVGTALTVMTGIAFPGFSQKVREGFDFIKNGLRTLINHRPPERILRPQAGPRPQVDPRPQVAQRQFWGGQRLFDPMLQNQIDMFRIGQGLFAQQNNAQAFNQQVQFDVNVELQEYADQLRKPDTKAEQRYSNIFDDLEIDLPDGHRCIDVVTGSAIDIPVKITEKQRIVRDGKASTLEKSFYFDFDTLHAIYFDQGKKTNPLTRAPFKWCDVQPAFEIIDELDKIIAEHKAEQGPDLSSKSSNSEQDAKTPHPSQPGKRRSPRLS